jgi:HlyD family secretion protein
MMRKIVLALVGLVMLGLFAGTLVFLWKRSQTPPVVWETREPFTATIVKKAVATGSVVPRREIAIKPQVSGIVDELYVEPGAKVAQGDLIARITIIPDIGSLAAAESRLERARIQLENAEIEHRRNRRLADDGLIAEATFRTFELALAEARQEVEAADDSLAVIRKGARKQAATATNTLVRATAAGMVLEVPVERGDSVIEANTFNDGTTIASVADMDEMVFEGKVDESEVGKLREGMALELTVGAIEDRRFDATLEHIAPKGVEENGAIQFEIRAALGEHDDSFLRANYSANADIVLARRDEVLAVQESWLQFDDGQAYVEVESAPQQFERRDVATGLSDGITIEVLDGLGTGDKVKDPNSAGAAAAQSG